MISVGFFDMIFSPLWVKSYEIVPGKTYGWSEVIQGWIERPVLLAAIILYSLIGIAIILLGIIRKK